MRLLIACLLLAGCANYPADLLGKPLDAAISHYGKPTAALDHEGARAFFFPINEPETQKPQRTKELLNPDMPILNTNFNYTGCYYRLDALWTSSTKHWTIHGLSQSPQCGDKN